jgi:glutamate synthase (NADPH/NADH) small chain
MVYRVSSAHEEGGVREYAITTDEFVGEAGRLTTLRTRRVEQLLVDGRMTFEPVEGSEEDYPADLVLLAMGFTGPERGPLLDGLGVDLDDRGNVARDGDFGTSIDNVWVCGDMGRGQSLIVWAIAEGRSCAAAVDRHLTGDTTLPSPVDAAAQPMRC